MTLNCDAMTFMWRLSPWWDVKTTSPECIQNIPNCWKNKYVLLFMKDADDLRILY